MSHVLEIINSRESRKLLNQFRYIKRFDFRSSSEYNQLMKFFAEEGIQFSYYYKNLLKFEDSANSTAVEVINFPPSGRFDSCNPSVNIIYVLKDESRKNYRRVVDMDAVIRKLRQRGYPTTREGDSVHGEKHRRWYGDFIGYKIIHGEKEKEPSVKFNGPMKEAISLAKMIEEYSSFEPLNGLVNIHKQLVS